MTFDVAAVGLRKKEDLLSLKKECFNCRLCTIGQNNAFDDNPPQVFARGNVFAKVVFIGQNPGKDEVLNRKPFVGQSGRTLDKMIAAVGLTEKQYYITNTVKCFTPGNRMPTDTEIKNCKPFLEKELAIVQPKVVVTLGNPALQRMTGLTGIMTLRGQVLYSEEFQINVFPLMHPATLLYNQKENLPKMAKNLKELKEYLHNSQ